MTKATKNLGPVLASDDEVDNLKPKAKKAKTRKSTPKVKSQLEGATQLDPKEKRVRIVLEENDNIPPTGQFISINGRTFMLRPGDAVEVPLCVINVLNDAVQAVPQLDQTTQQVVGYRKKLRFPYTVVPAAA